MGSASRWFVATAMVAMATAACTDGNTAPTILSGPPQEAGAVVHQQIFAEQSVGDLGELRVADGVIPPTNRWYSSLAFGDGCLPVFPRPLSVTPCDGGFSMGLTTPIASDAAIIAAAKDDVTVTFDGAQGPGTVTSANSVGASVAMGPATITLAQGWPAVAIDADAALTAHLSVTFASASEGVGTATVAGTTYGIVVANGSLKGSSLSLEQGGYAALFAVPDGIDVANFAAALGAHAPQTHVSWAITDDAATTTIAYGDAPTVVVIPQSRVESSGLQCDLGVFATIDGPYAACAASTVSWDVPRIRPSDSLSLDGITADEKKTLIATLEEEAQGALTLPGDSYFGAKALYRLANLVRIADALGETAIGDDLGTQLAEQLRMWADPAGCSTRAEKCFVYDPAVRGVVGLAPSFGSEDFNDHYFHYGYLLYAAAVAGARDASLLADIGPAMDVVADDIASPITTPDFPQWRAFDPVAGHSWASGNAPFADGNNQESSSEAVAAWNGVAQWRNLRGETDAAGTAEWMLSAEAESARRIYLAPDVSEFPEFSHGTIGIEWGSKRDFATWFSAEPNAIVGIQLIPAPPAAIDYYRLVPPASVASAIEAAKGEGSGSQFSDYLLMYAATQSTADAGAAWATAVTLPVKDIDDGNSRTYMLAWIASLRG